MSCSFALSICSLIRFYRRFKLINRRDLRIELLFRYGILREENPVSLQIDPGVREKSLVALHLTLGLKKLNLKRSWIDFGEKIPGEPFVLRPRQN